MMEHIFFQDVNHVDRSIFWYTCVMSIERGNEPHQEGNEAERALEANVGTATTAQELITAINKFYLSGHNIIVGETVVEASYFQEWIKNYKNLTDDDLRSLPRKYGIRAKVQELRDVEAVEVGYQEGVAEYDKYLEELTQLFFKEQKVKLIFSETIPSKLSRTHSKIRHKGAPKSWNDAKERIKNTKDVKDIFWTKVKKERLEISQKYKDAIKELIGE